MAQFDWLRVSVKGTPIAGVAVSAVKLNGRPLTSLVMIAQPGQLEFVAETPRRSGQPTTVSGFKSLSGLNSEMELADSRVSGQSRSVTGRITGVAVDPSVGGSGDELVTFVFHTIK
ncbi:MAG TPA: hypothetical protein VMQ73_22450 [Methylomirabilota bacterium]|nr:hypothetical protein [Methylomirabilota bacterium]